MFDIVKKLFKKPNKNMIYQLKVLYGAVLNGQVIYATETTFFDCTKPFKTIDENVCKHKIIEAIKRDGFKPEDFEIRFITQEEYDNRFDKDSEEVNTITFKKEDDGEWKTYE